MPDLSFDSRFNSTIVRLKGNVKTERAGDDEVSILR